MNPSIDPPVLWSFRRCPYAMRARLALAVSQTPCWLREVVLRNKPAEMVARSPKATVPVLVLANGTVIDESLDIMIWALERNDPEGWLSGDTKDARRLISRNDGTFKFHLDRYKYPDRYENTDRAMHRAEGLSILQDLNCRLASHRFLCSETFGLADAALTPFVRQFANTDRAWFDAQPLPRLQAWLSTILESHRFTSIMSKHPAWDHGPGTLVFSHEIMPN